MSKPPLFFTPCQNRLCSVMKPLSVYETAVLKPPNFVSKPVSDFRAAQSKPAASWHVPYIQLLCGTWVSDSLCVSGFVG